MHPIIIICIILAIITTLLTIYFSIKKHNVDVFISLFLILTVALVDGMGFGLICTTIPCNTTYEKIASDKIETHLFKNNGIIVFVYKGILYQSTEMRDLNVINNIDYYAFVKKYNAYNIELYKKLYPVEKGKIDD